jgi:hypothetical protein
MTVRIENELLANMAGIENLPCLGYGILKF